MQTLKIAVIGGGSSYTPELIEGIILRHQQIPVTELALVDVEAGREKVAIIAALTQRMLKRHGLEQVKVSVHFGLDEAIRGAQFVLTQLRVGQLAARAADERLGLKYHLLGQETTGVGGFAKALRTIPVMLDFARDIEEVCPDAWFLNYTNPMAMLTGAMLRLTNVKTVGLCHSVQVCASHLMQMLGMEYDDTVQWKIAGINHQAWLLEITKDGRDLYPELKKRALEKNKEKHGDMVRLELMRRFGYYITESSEHNSEYTPWFIKDRYPELIDRFNIPLDEYPRRCIHQIEDWKKRRDELINDPHLSHTRTKEYASYIMEAMETNRPYKIGGNVLNTNLPRNAVVEVPCLVDKSGVTPCYIGDLPEQCAALNRTNINVQLLTIEAARTRKKDYIYQAALLDPHTASELDIDTTIAMCDALIEAHGDWLPKFN